MQMKNTRPSRQESKTPVGSERDAPIDVRDMLSLNVREEFQFRRPLKLHRKKRKFLKYAAAMAVANALCYLPVLIIPGMFVGIFCLSGMVIVSVGITWITWVVID